MPHHTNPEYNRRVGMRRADRMARGAGPGVIAATVVVFLLAVGLFIWGFGGDRMETTASLTTTGQGSSR